MQKSLNKSYKIQSSGFLHGVDSLDLLKLLAGEVTFFIQMFG